VTRLHRPERGDDVGHGRHESEPDADEHEDGETVKVLAIALTRLSESHLRFA